MSEQFGDFEEIKTEVDSSTPQTEVESPTRIRLPRKGELLGVVIQRLGGNRMEIKTNDNKTRNCRVPGRFRRKFWLRQGDVVLITPWEMDDSKGDIIFQYRKGQKFQLKKRGLLNFINEGF
jgi:translation initiation factor 1A